MKHVTCRTATSSALDGNQEYHRFFTKSNELLQTNVSDHVFLPTIASMGDTSCGKSSVLSGLTNIELPSSDKLTTRCPVMLQMRHSETKSETVSINWKTIDPTKEKATKFKPKTVNESNWSELTSIIAQAQTHIVEVTGKEVARDVVSVELQGPDCVNLTVIDLPGIVRTTGKNESKTLVQDTQALIDEYMKNPRCVILAVHPGESKIPLFGVVKYGPYFSMDLTLHS